MLKFIGKRLVYILFVLPVVVLLCAILFGLSPEDPVDNLINTNELEVDRIAYKKIYLSTAKRHNLGLPAFYVSLAPSNYHTEFYKIIFPEEKAFYERMLHSGIPFQKLDDLYKSFLGLNPKIMETDLADDLKSQANNITQIHDFEAFHQLVVEIQKSISLEEWNQLVQKFEQYSQSAHLWRKWIPSIYYHGTQNNFHTLWMNMLTLEFGKSTRDGRLVVQKVKAAFFLTSFLLILSVLAVFPMGIWLGKKIFQLESKLLKVMESILLFFASIPAFWLATLLLIFFTTPEYGKHFHLFSSVSNYGFSESNGFWNNIWNNGTQLILPVICIAFADLAIVIRHTYNLLSQEKSKPYVLTAKMKGLSERQQIEHLFANSKVQLVTMISGGIMSAFAGTLVIEFIFNIPGMGRLLLDSIRFGDWPVLFAIIILLYLLASMIYLVTDLIYSRLDPRLIIGHE